MYLGIEQSYYSNCNNYSISVPEAESLLILQSRGSTLHSYASELVIHGEKEICFSSFAAHFEFPSLWVFTRFKSFPKHFFKTFRGCFVVWYKIFTPTLQQLRFQLADQSITLSISLIKSCQQVCQSAAAVLNPGF